METWIYLGPPKEKENSPPSNSASTSPTKPAMAVEVALNTPLAEALSNVVQPKLSEVGWSTGGLDDSALGEYIILMLVNGKTQEQIAAELSNDLLNLGPDDTGATDFAKWLFEQVNILNGQLNGPPTPQAQQSQVIPSYIDEGSLLRDGNRQPNGGRGTDADMGEAMDGVQNGVMYAFIICNFVIHKPLTRCKQTDRSQIDAESVTKWQQEDDRSNIKSHGSIKRRSSSSRPTATRD